MGCFTSFFAVIYHFISANSRHGTHSPFVYKLTEEVLYKRNKDGDEWHGAAWQSLLQDIASFFDVNISFDHSNAGRNRALQTDVSALTIDQLAMLQREFGFIALVGIYKSPQSYRIWKKIVSDKRFVVTIDLFYFGLMFCRTEQPKQNFKLRFPYWKY